MDSGSKRVCKTKAESTIRELTAACAPRGNPQAGVAERRAEVPTENHRTKHPDAHTNLGMLFRERRDVFNRGAEMAAAYVQRNASYEIQKAYAISLMTTAMSAWGCSVNEATRIASDCTSFNPETIHLWVSSFFDSFSDMLAVQPESTTDEDIDERVDEENRQPDVGER